mmetsp:Transcript_13424/g.26764  ORF Transcript_13424/g.26764 Transcript_13424/m.26764 type:complete len:90 (+) Transcript_13424:58-327(+)
MKEQNLKAKQHCDEDGNHNNTRDLFVLLAWRQFWCGVRGGILVSAVIWAKGWDGLEACGEGEANLHVSELMAYAHEPEENFTQFRGSAF